VDILKKKDFSSAVAAMVPWFVPSAELGKVK
jgi:hypothetical protein